METTPFGRIFLTTYVYDFNEVFHLPKIVLIAGHYTYLQKYDYQIDLYLIYALLLYQTDDKEAGEIYLILV